MTKEEWIRQAVKNLVEAEGRIYKLQGNYTGNTALMEAIKETIIRGKQLEDEMGN